MKLKVRDFFLCAIALFALILLVPTFTALFDAYSYYDDPKYMSLLGGIIGVLKGDTYGAAIRIIGVVQLLMFLGLVAIEGLIFLFSRKGMKTGFFSFLSILVGLLSVDWLWLDGYGFSFYALVAILIFATSIISPIVGKIEKAAAK